MDTNTAERIADNWIALQYTNENSDQYLPLIRESRKLDELSHETPLATIEVLACILAKNSSDHILANLGAGPLEDLLVVNGASVIEEIEKWASSDQLFRRALSMTWRRQIAEEIWQRVEAAANR